MYQPIKHTSTVRFRRYCRAGWAAFRSMHREVTIGHLATYIADRQLRKAAAPVAASVAMLLGSQTLAQADTSRTEERTLPAVEVILNADSLRASDGPAALLAPDLFNQTSVRTVGDLLALIPGLDLRARGTDDVQADLAMRGGTFDQMVVLLNGINLTDPQTGHHALDLPVDLQMVRRVELLTPAQLLARGVVGFCGGVNIVVDEAPPTEDAPSGPGILKMDLAAGSHGTARASLLASGRMGGWDIASAADYHRSDGYRPNTDYQHGSLFLQAAHSANRDDLHFSLGAQFKDFGSAGFYSTTYPDQFEATRTLTATASHTHRFGRATLTSSAYGRLHADRFELFRTGYAEAPAWYSGHNRHLSDLAGVRSVLAWKGLSLGVEARHEGILSNVLGDSSSLCDDYPLASSRTSASLFGSWVGSWRKVGWRLSALGQVGSQFGGQYAWGAGLTYSPTRRLRLNAELSRTFRLPTFTDLYYKSVNQVADRNLLAEHSVCAEVGARVDLDRLHLAASVYRRFGRQIIDWMRRPDEELWHAVNHARVDATGLDLSLRCSLPDFHVGPLGVGTEVGGSYAYCHIDQRADGWVSGSALDHLRHKALAYVALSPGGRLRLKADLQVRHRVGSFVGEGGELIAYGTVVLADASAEYLLITTARMGSLTLSLSGYNLADRSYRDHGGTPQPGRTFMVGLRLGT